ncbi:MAG: hypothetical protein RBT76_15550 [candidate division Zixibacteria bacterium]|jgi:hypothetical protein|nr:hypothetical protein [candidate division Zixibacteria bacterium]
MKRTALALCFSALLWSCSDDKGTNDPPDKPDSTWTPVESYSLSTPGADYVLLESPYLYASGRGGSLFIFDISNADTIRLIGSHAAENTSTKTPAGYGGRALAKRGSLLYACFYGAANGSSVVEVFDVVNPANPNPVGLLQSPWNNSQIWGDYWEFTGICITGDTLLAQTSGFAFLYRISGPNSFLPLDTVRKDVVEPTCQTGGISLWDFGAGHFYAYGSCTQTGQNGLLWTLSRGNMQVTGRLDMSVNPGLYSPLMRLNDNRVYLWETGGGNKMAEVDVSNPASPALIRSQQLFSGFPLLGGTTFSLTNMTAAGSAFVFLGRYSGGVLLCDDQFNLLRADKGAYSADAVYSAGRVYVCGPNGVSAYVIP